MRVVLLVLSMAAGRGDMLPTDELPKHETPFACYRTALGPAARKRHFDELSPALRARHTNIRELANGYEFDFPSDAGTVQLLMEWVAGEQLCCPFFDIDVRLEREGGPLWMRLTGRDGVKQFVRGEFVSWFAK